MALYKCGYCGKQNEESVWCSQEHRKLWYKERDVRELGAKMEETTRQGEAKAKADGKKRGRPKKPK